MQTKIDLNVTLKKQQYYLQLNGVTTLLLINKTSKPVGTE